MSRNVKVLVYTTIFLQDQNLVHEHPQVSEMGFVAFVFIFESRGKKDITRLTRAQLVEEGIVQGDHSREVFNALELHHVGAGVWAC